MTRAPHNGHFIWEPMVYAVGRVVTLPVPPSANRYARTGKGRMYTPIVVEQYETSVRIYLQSIRAVPLRGVPVLLELDWHRARQSGDLSNRIKILEDCLSGHLFEDDRQVARIVATRYEDKTRPRIEVRVTPWHGEAERAA